MRGPRRIVAAALTLATLAAPGCGGMSKRTLTASEPSLSALPGDPEVAAVEPAKPSPSRSVSFADRHPLFTKPRQYYDSTKNSNKAVKAAAATVIGVPAGIFGELKQIVVGAPASPTPPGY